MTLQVTTEPRENRQLAVSIVVPQERVDRELRKAASKLASQYRLPGFRAGKAPYNIVVQQFGLPNLYNEFLDELGQEVFRQAMEQEQIAPYAMASIEDVSFDPLTYTLIVPLEPTVTLGDYRALRIEEPSGDVDEEAVEGRLAQMRGQHATWRTVTRPSQYGDELTIDVKSVIREGDTETIVLDETGWEVTPDQENPMDPPGFDEALVGLETGETREFSLGWPEDKQSIYAGKTADFVVTVQKIDAYEEPPLDDAFAALVNPEHATLEELRAEIRKNLEDANSSRRDQEYINTILDAIVEQSQLEYPPAVIEDQLDSMMEEFERRLRMFGIEDIERYFEQVGQDPDEYRESLREGAIRQARRNLVLSEIVRTEQIAVDDTEIEERLETLEKSFGSDEVPPEEVTAMLALMRVGTGRRVIENDLLREKSVARLVAIARGESVPELPAPVESAPELAAPNVAASEQPAPDMLEAVESASETMPEGAAVKEETSAASDE